MKTVIGFLLGIVADNLMAARCAAPRHRHRHHVKRLHRRVHYLYQCVLDGVWDRNALNGQRVCPKCGKELRVLKMRRLA